VPGTDPYGNSVHDGFTAYNGNAYAQLHVNSAQDIPAIELHSGNASEADAPAFYNIPINPGAVNESSALVISGPGSSYDDSPPAMWFTSSAKDGSGTGYLAFGLNGTNALNVYLSTNGFHISVPVWGSSGNIVCGDVLAAQKPGAANNTPEVWHAATPFVNNWANKASTTTLEYKLYPDNTVGITGQIYYTTGTPASTSSIFSLPTGYYSTTKSQYGTGLIDSSGAITSALLAVNTGGTFEVIGATGMTSGSSGSFLSINMRYPIDS
jgi:hypothetical protein